MKRLKYVVSIIVVALTIGYTCIIGDFNVLNLRNDSGFDTSYDSGGGYSGGSSSSYDRSPSYSYSHSSSYSNGESTGGSISIEVVIIIFILLIVPITIKFLKVKKEYKSSILSEDDIRKVIPNFNLQQFFDDRLNDFIEIQIAWQDFNYDKLREKLTDSLYNQYVMQLDTLKSKNQRNVMCNFEKYGQNVSTVKEENGMYIIQMELALRFKDYIEENGKVVRGNKNVTIFKKYGLKFICSKEEQSEYCPNCGAKLTDSASQTCDYCRTTISRVSTKWVLSEKESLYQSTSIDKVDEN